MKTKWFVLLTVINVGFAPFFLAGFTVAIWTGIAEAIDPYSNTNPYLVAGISYIIYLGSMILLSLFAFKRNRQSDALAIAERERLDKIKKSMTPAEWEQYKIQLEIKADLDAIRRNSNSTQKGYGFFWGNSD